MQHFTELFTSQDSQTARKVLAYVDDQVLDLVIQTLDASRNDWRQRKMRPLYRNITKAIIQKSAMLYKDGLPSMEVFNNGVINDAETDKYITLLTDQRFLETMANLDIVVRGVKTAQLLLVVNPETNIIHFQILHRGNSFIDADPVTRQINKVTIRTGPGEYRIITPEFYEDFASEDEADAVLISREPNPYGMIPIVTFYDQSLPRTGYYINTPEDLITFNDEFNLHLSDLAYAAGYSIHKTMVTTAAPDDVTTAIQAGLGTTLYVENQPNGDPTTVDFIGPDIDLLTIQTTFSNWIIDIASDWSVNINPPGTTNEGVSGFSLIVKEKDSLELKQIRSYFQGFGLEQLFNVYKIVYNTHQPDKFSDNTLLEVIFEEPKLPFNERENEEIWESKIGNDRASIIDYLMATKNITRQEALIVQQRISKENAEADVVDLEDGENT